MDSFIANDENFLPGLAKMLCSHEKLTQELAAKCLDYVSITPDNQTLICTTDSMMKGMVQLLKNTRSIEARSNVLQSLVYLSANPKNRFTIARVKNILDEFKNCMSFKEPAISHKTIQVIYNLCLMKENIPLVARHNDLRIAIKARHSDVQDKLHGSKEEYEGFQNDIVTFKLTGVVLDLLYTFDTRLNSKIILRGEGYNSPSIVIGKHVSKSMVTGFVNAPQQENVTTNGNQQQSNVLPDRSTDQQNDARSQRSERLMKVLNRKNEIEAQKYYQTYNQY
jgi:hypothetical protein